MNDRKTYHKKWREQNRSHVNESSRRYVRANPQQRSETSRRHRTKTKTDRTTFIKQIIRTAQHNAKKAGLEFSISFDLINAWIAVQGERCILTNFSFDYSIDARFRTRPFAPSIDRKDNSKGYTVDNIQLVCCIVNRAKNEFTQEMFDEMCVARVRMLNNG